MDFRSRGRQVGHKNGTTCLNRRQASERPFYELANSVLRVHDAVSAELIHRAPTSSAH